MSLLTLEQQREAAQLLFPTYWAASFAATGRRRHNLQRRLRQRATLELLRRTGARCSNCTGYRKGGVCDTHSDFHGDTQTQPDNLCLDYHAEI